MSRKAFNFYRSYYDVARELSDKDRAAFLWAICQRQFEGVETELNGLAKIAYISQKHNIDSQVFGYENKTNTKLTPTEGGSQGGSIAPTEGGSVQEKEKEEEKGELNSINFSGLLKFINHILGKNYQVINIQIKNKYNARLKDGYTKEQIMSAIINASKDAYHVETKFKYLTPEFFSRSTIIDKYGFTSTKENEETKPDTLMDWEWEAMLRNREEVRKIQAYAAKEK